ncbi:MAG: putative oxidoreductase [Alphaproteobacteria bacterium ADurb.Bin438]|nr:MAG: putative oxidoreductase [Alphaproteobacteria bacterium ADurb.Bin438]
MYDVIVVGASFAGLNVSYHLASKGLKVLVIEQKPSVDAGLKSTGILTKEAYDYLTPFELNVNEIKTVNLYSPSLKKLELTNEGYAFYTTNLGGILTEMYEKAKSKGVEFKFNQFFDTSFTKQARFIIGADGADSDIAKIFKLDRNKKFLIGYEIHVKNHNFSDKQSFSCYLDHNLAKGYIGWVAPFDDHIQIGLAGLKGSKLNLEKFVKKLGLANNINDLEIVEKRSGLIPVNGPLKRFFDDKIILIGDASGLVSPLSAGGIYPSLIFSEKIAGLLYDHLENNAPHPGLIIKKSYPDYRFKKLLRFVINLMPNFMLNICFYLPFFKQFATQMFFHERKY